MCPATINTYESSKSTAETKQKHKILLLNEKHLQKTAVLCCFRKLCSILKKLKYIFVTRFLKIYISAGMNGLGAESHREGREVAKY